MGILKRKEKYLKILKNTFRLEKFKNKQFTIIDAIVHKKKDVCCVLSTGYGKSICYQLPAIVTGKPSLVISPLLSLMEDQRINMEKIGLKACCYNSSLKDDEKKEIRKKSKV